VHFGALFKNGINKWRFTLLIFSIIYAFFLLLELGYMSIQWDEAPHMVGSLLLFRGRAQEYIATYGYYPPLYDLLTTGFFQTLGVSATSGRLTAVTFSLLSIWAIFELSNRSYGPKTALLSSIILGTMPGFFWLSRVAMLETMLVFFFTISMFFFLSWTRSKQDKALILCGLALGIGFLAKYQVLVAGIVMITTILLLYRNKLQGKLTRFLIIVPIVAAIVITPWIFIVVQTNGLDTFGELLYVIREGGEERITYSTRFPLHVFYLIEMTYPFNDIPVHPISLPIYILSLLGLGLWAYRRKTDDKLLLLCFIVVFVFYTLIPNKHWRYIIPVFPVLAISAANFIFSAYHKIASWKPKQPNISNDCLRQITAALFIILITSAVVYSSYNTYQMTERDQKHIPIQETVNYATSNMTQNESIVLVCAFNLFNQDMLRFYLPENMTSEQVWQYPERPVDAYKPDFNITELIDLCEERNVKWVVIYDYGAHSPFFNTTLTIVDVKTMMLDSGRFGTIADEPWYGFGTHPNRVFIFGFLRNQL
jgi:4-amino-4-deoxy-L-arabinose transferase-like glycosyltransferase